MSDYFEAEVEPLFGSETSTIYKKRKTNKVNGQYSYQISIIKDATKKTVYETVSWGKNQKDAILNFRKIRF